jgi:hypothetical protein
MKSIQSFTLNSNKTILAVVAALLLLSVSGTVIDLTDETFEHQTQASTGQVSVDCWCDCIIHGGETFAGVDRRFDML